MQTVRILIADDHGVVRRGVRALLQDHPGWRVCEEAATGGEAVRKAKWLKPDVVVMDITMPEMSGLDATRAIRAAVPGAKVLILTIHETEQIVREVLDAGASGYVSKSDLDANLIAAVESLSRGKVYFSSAISEIVGGKSPQKSRAANPGVRRRNPLTARQRDIVRMIAEGKTNKEVASALHISVKTAETHRLRIMRKLSLQTISELVRYAIRHKISKL